MAVLKLMLIVIRLAVGLALVAVAAGTFAMIACGMAVGEQAGEHWHASFNQMYLFLLGGLTAQFIALGLIFGECALIMACFTFEIPEPTRDKAPEPAGTWLYS